MEADQGRSLRDFLEESAVFPFPNSNSTQSCDPTEPSLFEAGRLDRRWKAARAIRDSKLVDALCSTLDEILDDKRLSASEEIELLARFAPKLDHNGEIPFWKDNLSERKACRLLDKAFFDAATQCLRCLNKTLATNDEPVADGYASKVDYDFIVDLKRVALADAKSDQVLSEVGSCLPAGGFHLNWHNRSLMEKVILNAALYMASWKTEWLFLTSYNHWIFLRLHRGGLHSPDQQPYVTYSSMLSIEGETRAFRAFLGALLAAANEVDVPSSKTPKDVELDVIPEDARPKSESFPEELAALRITMAPPETPEPNWFSLQEVNPTFTTRLTDNTGEPIYLRLTRPLGHGTTGLVYECQLEAKSAQDIPIPRAFAVKFVEVLKTEDESRRDRLRHEFGIYQILERACRQPGQLSKRIAPQCFGMFEGGNLSVLILELQGSALRKWEDLNQTEKEKVLEVAQELHGLGIVHEDLEPRNVVRTIAGGFSILDFTESRMHNCKEKKPVMTHGFNL
ncbi:hypothetical protein DFH11DRAFT_1512905 [Phellopilus nigrolimitatus]|nr:hypothetical protein DFH11DRAFT_1512905 [Phellopilus nigrolimitatus]